MATHQKTEKRRNEIVAAAASHLVAFGFQKSGLRAIAKSVGISDRMIMYYFETKEDLISEALELVGESLANGMDTAVPRGNMTAVQVLTALSDALRTDEVRSVMQLWFEIIGMAMRGEEPYRQTAALLLARSEEQIRSKLRSDQKHKAREVLAALEGGVMIELLLD
jgi:AcrR family transcriptional regulator